MPLPPRLEQELDELRSLYQIEAIEEPDTINLIFSQFVLGEGYSVTNTDLLLRVPRTYADAGPDMFWTTVDVLLAGGAVPLNAEPIERYVNRDWRRFSWHRAASCPWNPNTDNLHGYLEFIRKRLREKK